MPGWFQDWIDDDELTSSIINEVMPAKRLPTSLRDRLPEMAIVMVTAEVVGRIADDGDDPAHA